MFSAASRITLESQLQMKVRYYTSHNAILRFNHSLEFSKYSALILREVSNDAGVGEQLADVAVSKDQI